ncbi:beta-hydroxyacyl-ACP dehydratase [Bacillus sp. WMMC1349]|uniref:3-hydroxyacyl-ACP dehydratase FabZ family protein n=1 Tax=Bacillus sp. WMMC1349 TaxID=2736254 RepID=UPI001554595A|nr:beta-hydroxyacyl-ACP dehydratase [Bacillus sp. WMMC1349]NPC91656.1 beta-hydroxyacyl-ACP dehydratase [Bacillus sp. WMMC1349]
MTDNIEAVLPHRHPFLFITEVKKTVDSIKVEGAYQISHDNMYVVNMNGEKHFPSLLVVESLAQLSAFAEEGQDNADLQELVFLTGLQDMQFLKPIYAGDLVKLKVEIIRRRRGLTLIEGTASVNGDIVVRGKIKTKRS